MNIQAIIITAENGERQVFIGYPIIDDSDVETGFDSIEVSNTFPVPDEATLLEALNVINGEFLVLESTEEVLH